MELEKYNEKNNPKIGYSYCGYHGIVLYPNTHPMRGNFQIQSRPFDPILSKVVPSPSCNLKASEL